MSTSIFYLWTCCNCNGSTQSFFLEFCGECECQHQICENCNSEFHRQDGISCDWKWNLPDITNQALPEDVLCNFDGGGCHKVHDDSITNAIENDAGCRFNESHVAFNSMDLHTPLIPCIPTDSDCSSPEGAAKMDIDEHTTEEPPWDGQEVELRKEAIWHKFRQCQEKFSKPAKSNGFRKQPKTVSPYFKQLRDPTCFAFAYERCVLPLVLEFATSWLGSTYTINVVQASKPGNRIILFMSAKELAYKQQSELQGHVLNMLPPKFHETTSFHFSTGFVERLFGTVGTSKDDEDRCEPRNPYYYSKPTMGDSIGWSEDEEPSAATLGPCLKIINAEGHPKCYWLINYHLFQSAFTEERWPEEDLSITHPASADQELCIQNEEREHNSIKLGVVEEVSGCNWKTTRISGQAEVFEELDMDPFHVVVDWALAAAENPTPNLPRSSNSDADKKCRHITSINDVHPDALTFSTGRSSGFQDGQISSCPAVVSGACNGTGIDTREWVVHRRGSENYLTEEDDEWAGGGIGVGGDSGACIVDSDNNKLYGQVWGRNIYYGKGPRITYFTDINDIFNDIKKYPKYKTIELPECDSVEDSAVPACSRCHHSKQILETTRRVKTVELGLPSNNHFCPTPLQDAQSDGSLTAKRGTPSKSFDIDLEFAAEELSFFGRDYSVTQSSTNLTDDTSELRSPPDIISPHPKIYQDPLGLAGIRSYDPLFGSLPMRFDENDLVEWSESGSHTGDKEKMRESREVSQGPEGKRSYDYDEVSGKLKVVHKRQKT